MLGSPNPSHYVFALRIRQVVAEKFFSPVRGIACERNTGTGVGSHVAEHHGHYIDGRAQIVRNLLSTAIGFRPFAIPRTEDGLNGLFELLLRIRWKILLGFTFDNLPEFAGRPAGDAQRSGRYRGGPWPGA